MTESESSERARAAFSQPFWGLYADEHEALDALTRMACPAPCVGVVNETGWHLECEQKARRALAILRSPHQPTVEEPAAVIEDDLTRSRIDVLIRERDEAREDAGVQRHFREFHREEMTKFLRLWVQVRDEHALCAKNQP